MKQTAIYRPHRPQIASIHIMIEALEGKIRSLNLHSGTDLAIEQLSQNLLEEAYHFLVARVTGGFPGSRHRTSHQMQADQDPPQ